MGYPSGQFSTPEPAPNPIERPLAAVKRYKWLILATTILGTAAGVLGMKFVTPKYEVVGLVWVATAPSQGNNAAARGPIQGAALLASNAWIELFRSYKVVDEVVRKLGLYVEPAAEGDKVLFADFNLADRYVPGQFDLYLNRDAKTWKLVSSFGVPVDSGVAGDSIGRRVGYKWVIPKTAFDGKGERDVKFTVTPPREKSLNLNSRINPRLALGSNFLWLTFSDVNPQRAARILNTWIGEYVRVAAQLKNQNIIETSKILEQQLRDAEKATLDAEAAYQRFRVSTITEPTEGGPVASAAPGSQAGNSDPAVASFLAQRVEYDNLRHDREALEVIIANATARKAGYGGALLIPSVAAGPGAQALRTAIDQVHALQADYRAKRLTFTDEHQAVRDVSAAIAGLETQTIPQLAEQVLQQLRARENDYERRIAAASKELQQIPPRTIEERRLARAVTVQEGLYSGLKSRFAEAQLIAAGATPDVNPLDTAVAPLSPTKNTGIMILAAAIFGGIAAGLALAILLDQMDKKVRYATQVTSDLGLVVAGAVPRMPKGGIDAKSPDQVVQFLESFRTLRMHVMHSGPGERITLAVTSAQPGDGKSLISANLALSFAEAGLKTVLIDGDTRRGSLHRMHGLTAAGGLTEYLVGSIDETQAVRATSHPNLSLVSCGVRHPRSPELLASPRLKRLVEKLSQRFDVVIVDTPPLAAGIDGYAISAAAGRVLMVVRMGQTQRRLAGAKLATLDRLPVNVVGAVLNAVPGSSEFQYYTYSAGYGIDGGDGPGELVEAGTER